MKVTHAEVLNCAHQKKLEKIKCPKCKEKGHAVLEPLEDIKGNVSGWFCWCQCSFITPVKKTKSLAVLAFEIGERYKEDLS